MYAYRVNVRVESIYAVTVPSDKPVTEDMLEAQAKTILENKDSPQYQPLVHKVSELPVVSSVRRLQVNYFNSSVLLKGIYDDVNRVLTLVLRSGKVYRYEGLHDLTWQELIMAESAGEYYNSFIRGNM